MNITKKKKILKYKLSKIEKFNKNRQKKSKLFKFKFNYIFLKKFFSLFIKKGLKYKVICLYTKFIRFIKNKHLRHAARTLSNYKGKLNLNKTKKFLKYKNKIILYAYLVQVINKIIPVVSNTIIFKRGEKKNLPLLTMRNKKLIFVGCNWIKKSVLQRKEKTLFLKIVSEFESIRRNSSQTKSYKKEYYSNFYKNKFYIKLLKRRT